MSNPEIDKLGIKRWLNDKGQLHREDGPAVEYTDGSKEFHINGRDILPQPLKKLKTTQYAMRATINANATMAMLSRIGTRCWRSLWSIHAS